MKVATTIYEQLGGNKFKAMVGAKHLAGSKNSLQFVFKMCRKANQCCITLNSLDLYDIAFNKVNYRTYKSTMVQKYNGIYADQLTKIFESFTGLYTSL